MVFFLYKKCNFEILIYMVRKWFKRGFRFYIRVYLLVFFIFGFWGIFCGKVICIYVYFMNMYIDKGL